jgi:hypothetical protein
MGSFLTARVFPLSASTSTADPAHGAMHHRRISPQAGRALEILGHAIEYLSDEFAHAGGSLSAHDAQVEAVQLLMGINRQIYFACPEVPTLAERLRTLRHLHAA